MAFPDKEIDMKTSSEWYELRNLVYSGEYSRAKKLLEKMPSLPSETNTIGETVLQFLVVENDIKGVKWLSENGFNMHVNNAFGQSTLFDATSLGYFELVDYLLENGADLDHKDNNGDDVFDYLAGINKLKAIGYLRKKLLNK